MDACRWWRHALVGVLVVAIATLLLPGVVAGVDTVGHQSTDGADPVGTEPLANASGPTEVIVRFEPIEDVERYHEDDVVDELVDHADVEQAAFETFADDHDAVSVESEFWLANAMLVTVDADEVDAADLLAVSNVTRVHENVEIETFAVDGDTPTGDDTSRMSTDGQHQTSADAAAYTPGLELIDVPAAWDRFETRGAGATVAVIDTGVDPTHQDVDLHGWAEFDENGTLVSDDLGDARDPNGHGTHVAGTVAGGSTSGTHIGVAPDARMYGINTFDADGTATFASVLAGMEHATATEEVDVLQMSLGANGTIGGFIGPVHNARATDRIVIAASGNTGHETSSSPANVYDALAVGAVQGDRTIATFSSGETINKTAAYANPPAEWPDHYVVPDATAPGVGVTSAEAGTRDGYVELQGTSMAAPHVSGIAALTVAATDGRIGGDDLQSAIVDTAVHPDGAAAPDDRYGHGVVDAEAAVETGIDAAPPPTPTPTPTPAPTPTPTPDVIEPAVNDDATGFGSLVAIVAVVVAVVALAAASDAGHRRRE